MAFLSRRGLGNSKARLWELSSPLPWAFAAFVLRGPRAGAGRESGRGVPGLLGSLQRDAGRWHLLAWLLTSVSTNGDLCLLLKKQTAKKHTHKKTNTPYSGGLVLLQPHPRAVSLEFCSPASRRSPWGSAARWRGFVPSRHRAPLPLFLCELLGGDVSPCLPSLLQQRGWLLPASGTDPAASAARCLAGQRAESQGREGEKAEGWR